MLSQKPSLQPSFHRLSEGNLPPAAKSLVSLPFRPAPTVTAHFLLGQEPHWAPARSVLSLSPPARIFHILHEREGVGGESPC